MKELNVRLLKSEDNVADSDVKHRENNFVPSGDGIPGPEDNENCSTVREVLQNNFKLIIPTVNFLNAARLGKQNSTKKATLMKMKSPADKDNVQEAYKAMKPNFLQMTIFPQENRQSCM